MSSSMRWQFRHEFDKFCTDNNIIHELSSPYNPESNGLAESAMKTMMSLVITCKMQKESLTNMSREEGTSARQELFGRRQRQVLPMLTDKLDLAAIDMTTRDQLAEEKTKYRSLHTQTYEPLEIGDRMWRHHHKTKKWHMQATVLHSRAGGSYFIQADNDKEYIGWRHFLPLVNETPKTDIKADKVRRLTLITMPRTSKYSEGQDSLVN